MKHTWIENKISVTEFDTLGEFLSYIKNAPKNKFYQNRNNSESEGYSFTHTHSCQEAEELATKGWDRASVQMSNKIKVNQTTEIQSHRTKPVYGVVGSQASVPRYLQGIPTNMVSRTSVPVKQKIITITKGISYSGNWTTDKMIEESLKALQIVQNLEAKGQRVKLNVSFMAMDNARKYYQVCKVCIKQPDERLNIAKLAFPLAHPSMLRRFMLRFTEINENVTRDLGHGYGTPCVQIIKDKVLQKGEYYLPEEIGDIEKFIKTLGNTH